MPDKENFELNQDVPAIDIPDLKKKEKERKKSGAAWGSGKPAGSPFSGATGGQGAATAARSAASAARSAASAARSAAGASVQAGVAAQAGFFAQMGGVFASLTSTLLGKAVALTAAAFLVGGAAAIAYKALSGGGAGGRGLGPDLGAISSTLRVRRDQGSQGLEYAAGANRGQIRWENTDKGAAPKTEKAEETKPADAMDKTAGVETAGENEPRDKMAHDLSGSRLSAGMGNDFGSHNIFSGGGASKFGPAVGSGMLSKFGKPQAAKSSRGGMLAKRPALGSANMNLRGIKSNRALSQLRGMGPYNAKIRGATSRETGADAATAQFEGAETQGGGAAAPISPTDAPSVGGAGAGSGGGAGGVNTAPYQPTIENCGDNAYWDGSTCRVMDIGGENITPWQKQVDASKALVLIAAALITIASIMWTIGTATICSGGSALQAIACTLGCLVGGVLGVVCVVLGAQVNSMGGSPQGTMIMIQGGLITATAAWAIYVPGGGSLLGPIILGALVMMSSVFGKLLGVG